MNSRDESSFAHFWVKSVDCWPTRHKIYTKTTIMGEQAVYTNRACGGLSALTRILGQRALATRKNAKLNEVLDSN